MTHTPGPWLYESACPGHYAGWEEPEEPDIPATIYAEVDGHTVPICTLDDPVYYAEHYDELDSHDDGTRRIGSVLNGVGYPTVATRLIRKARAEEVAILKARGEA